MNKSVKKSNNQNSKNENLALKNEGDKLILQSAVVNGQLKKNGVALDHLPAPEKTFTADSADVVIVGNTVRLIFWMSKRYGDGARGLVEIVMTKPSVNGFVATLKPVQNISVKVDPFSPLKEEPANSIALSSNFVRVGCNDYTAVFDFFYASAMSMHPDQENLDQMYIKGVVRIETIPSVFFGIVNYLKEGKY